MTAKEMFEMRQKGATFQEIGDAAGMSRQGAQGIVVRYAKNLVALKRGKGSGLYLDKIVYQGIYEHFVKNEEETFTSFARKIYDHEPSTTAMKMRGFLMGEHDSYYTIGQIKKMCEIVGKPFEEVFKERETDERH